MDRFHIAATGHSLNYLPQYIAQKLGFFADAGLAVTREVPVPWMQVLKDIDTGHAAAALGGLWVPAMLHATGRNYRAFAQMSARCPLVLISRRKTGNFRWTDLEGRQVLVTSTGGMGSYAYMAGQALRVGIPVHKIRFIRDLEYDFMLELFLGGLGDYMLVDVPTADRLAEEGTAHPAVALFDETAVPWSVYYAPASALDNHPEIYDRFLTALQRGFDWLHAHPVSDLSDELGRLWPDYPTTTVIGWLERFRAAGMWQRGVSVDPDATATWQAMIMAADLIEQPVPSAKLIYRTAETISA